jgi:thiol-disulfide isomerase/thioredoxin
MNEKSNAIAYSIPFILGVVILGLIVLFVYQTKKDDVAISEGLAPVSSVDVMILESFPVQVNALVKGEFSNGCYSLGAVEQIRNGNVFTVTLRSVMSGEMCTQAIVPFEKSISLDVAGLPKGEYQVVVNGVVGAFSFAVDNVLLFNDKSGPESFSYVGTLIAGSSSPFIEFNRADYERALLSGKTILLYFYAKWCPICKLELSNAATPAFNEYAGDNVIAFRVNYNDSDADGYEKGLAEKFGVLYQHTKVVIRNSDQVEVFPSEWTKDDYLQAFISNN